MGEKIITKKYVFTVEGETEKWYFNWLTNEINNSGRAQCKVSILPIVEKNPIKYAKRINQRATPVVTHICDIESNEPCHEERFHEILSQMKEAKTKCNTNYLLGYSNFTFELWMVLHKANCNGSLTNRTQYLDLINRAYGEHFESLDKYKAESNFKRCLKQLSIDDVISAVNRARRLMEHKDSIGETPCHFKGFKYYRNNPALSVWEAVNRILCECGILKC